MLTKDETAYLKELVKRELTNFKAEEKTSAMNAALKFLKAEHEYGHFLEKLLEKL